jgi:hypothetical protein
VAERSADHDFNAYTCIGRKCGAANCALLTTNVSIVPLTSEKRRLGKGCKVLIRIDSVYAIRLLSFYTPIMLSTSSLAALLCSFALLAAITTAYPLDLSSDYSASSLFSRASSGNTTSALSSCLSQSGAILSYSSSSSYAQLAKAENTNYNYRPDVIVQPSNAQQVSAIVKCVAKDQGKTKITPRSGGHSYTASCLTGNVVIDLSKLTNLSINDGAKTVSVGSGMTLGPLAKAIGDKGYALPHGTCPTVGVGGHSVGGGWGYTSRSWGWLLDRSEFSLELSE